MLTTLRFWLSSAIPLLKVLSAATVWTDKDDKAVAWLEKFNNDPDAAIEEIKTFAGMKIRLGLANLLGWLEDHINHTKTADEVLQWLHHLIVDPTNPIVSDGAK